MNRQHFLAAASAAASLPLLARTPPAAATARRNVAFAISDNANVMDMAGPWEVFQDAAVDGDGGFSLYHVSETTAPVKATAGMTLVPAYAFADAPAPDVIVVGAQRGAPGLVPFLQAHAARAVVLSVCTGAFKVAAAGLFDGKRATTHHDFYDRFAKEFPKVALVRGERVVDEGTVVSAGGLTSGIDGALHVVERFHGKAVADATSRYMEFVRTARPA